MADLIKISDSTSTTSSVIAASCTAVKTAMDKANSANTAATNAKNTSITGLSVSGKTITYTKGNGTTGTITTQDTNTTYSAGTGISISSNTITNSGVTSINGSTGAVTGFVKSVNGVSANAAGNVAVGVMPNYSAGVAVANLIKLNTAWTAPSDGILTAHIRVSGSQSRAALNINGTTTGHITNNSTGYVENGVSMTVPVSNGDVVKLVNVTGTGTVLEGSTVTFYPLKGA